MIFKQECNDVIEEVNIIMDELGISEEHSKEILNIYFEFFNNISFCEFMANEIKVFSKENNSQNIKILEDYDDACAFEGEDYILITNYQTVKEVLEYVN